MVQIEYVGLRMAGARIWRNDMKIKKLGVLVCCVLALCLGFALAGCDGEEASKKAFGGYWSVVDMEQDGEITTAEDMSLLRSLGLDVTLSLNEDLSATLTIFGSVGTGTWTPKTSKEATFTLDGQDIELTLEDDQLHLVNNTTTMNFTRSEEAPASDEGEVQGAEPGGEAADDATTDDTAADDATTDDTEAAN